MNDTVKLIIEIPKSAYKACKELKTDNDDGIIGLCAVNSIANGTPLPEDHRFIDADRILDHALIDEFEGKKYYSIEKDIMDSALVLFNTLEADKESKE